MNLLLLPPLAVPFACLALLSLVALLGVVALAGALHVVGAIKSRLGIAGRASADPWHGMVGDAHPLDYVEGAALTALQRSASSEKRLSATRPASEAASGESK
jgi:hypothetical protein